MALMLRDNSSLITFEFDCDYDDASEGVMLLAEALKKRKCSLSTFRLSNTCIGDNGLLAIANALMENESLTSLLLPCCEISSNAKFLSDALIKNKFLRKLNLLKNNIGSSGAVDLACALKENNILKCLDLSQNAICPLGAIALGAALCQNNALTELHLRANVLEDEGLSSIFSALKKNSSLITLSLGLHCLSKVKLRCRVHNFFRNFRVHGVDDNYIKRNQIKVVEMYFQKEIQLPDHDHLLKCSDCRPRKKDKYNLLYYLLAELKAKVQPKGAANRLPNLGSENDVEGILMKTTKRLKL
eukprot:Awhi_evm1s14398